MEPASVFKIMWQFRWVTLSVLLLTGLASVYTVLFAEHTYRAGMTFALITPKVPTAAEILEKPELGKLNADNPYLRSPDNTLLSQVLITKMSTQAVVDELRNAGLSTDYAISQPVRDPSQVSYGPGMLLQLKTSAASPEAATRTAEALGTRMVLTLREMQKINGADDLYIATALSVGGASQAEEDRSSDLRSVVALILSGGVFLFGALAMSRKVQQARDRRLARHVARLSTADAQLHRESLPPLWSLEVDREKVDR